MVYSPITVRAAPLVGSLNFVRLPSREIQWGCYAVGAAVFVEVEEGIGRLHARGDPQSAWRSWVSSSSSGVAAGVMAMIRGSVTAQDDNQRAETLAVSYWEVVKQLDYVVCATPDAYNSAFAQYEDEQPAQARLVPGARQPPRWSQSTAAVVPPRAISDAKC